MLISSSLLIDVYALFSDVRLKIAKASMTQAEIPGPFLLKSDVVCSIIWFRESGCCGLLFCGFCFFVDMRLPRIQCR